MKRLFDMAEYFDLDPPMDMEGLSGMDWIRLRPSDNRYDADRVEITSSDKSAFYLPHKAWIEISGSLTKANGSALGAGAADNGVAMTNNIMSIFKTLNYQLNGTSVELLQSSANIASTIVNLAQYSDDYSRSVASSSLWYRDTGTGIADNIQFPQIPIAKVGGTATAAELETAIGALNFSTSGTYNTGWTARQALLSRSKKIRCAVPLSAIFGFAKDVKHVITGVEHRLILNREDPAVYVHRTATGTQSCKFVIDDLNLWMPQLKPSLSTLQRYEEQLLKSAEQILEFEDNRVYKKKFDSADTSPSWNVTTNNQNKFPSRIFIALQDVKKTATGADAELQNSMIFDHGNVQKVRVFINGHRFPEQHEYELNYADNVRRYVRPYMDFLEASKKFEDVDSGSIMSIEEYASLYPIYYFDIGRVRDSLLDTQLQITIELDLRAAFASTQVPGTTTDYYIYAIICSDRQVKLDGIGANKSITVL